jgi:hypothetical protein
MYYTKHSINERQGVLTVAEHKEATDTVYFLEGYFGPHRCNEQTGIQSAEF